MIKIFLVFISIILASYFLVSCQKEDDILYRVKTGKQDFQWKDFTDENTKPKYRGEISNGEQNGLGSITLPDGENYVREWKDGKRNRQGTQLSSFGEKFEGERKNDKKNGQGTEIFLNGSKYVGKFKNGKHRRKKLLSGISPLSE